MRGHFGSVSCKHQRWNHYCPSFKKLFEKICDGMLHSECMYECVNGLVWHSKFHSNQSNKNVVGYRSTPHQITYNSSKYQFSWTAHIWTAFTEILSSNVLQNSKTRYIWSLTVLSSHSIRRRNECWKFAVTRYRKITVLSRALQMRAPEKLAINDITSKRGVQELMSNFKRSQQVYHKVSLLGLFFTFNKKKKKVFSDSTKNISKFGNKQTQICKW